MLNNNLNKDYLTIDKCLELTKGNYGHETIKELLKWVHTPQQCTAPKTRKY